MFKMLDQYFEKIHRNTSGYDFMAVCCPLGLHCIKEMAYSEFQRREFLADVCTETLRTKADISLAELDQECEGTNYRPL
jgi:hypothetical protein